jgi:hypothetical protein
MSIRTPLQVRQILFYRVKNKTPIEPGPDGSNVGWCKREMRKVINIPVSHSTTAKEAYAETQHRFTGMWIPGALAWWSNNGAWHVAWCAFRKGYVYTTDCTGPGFFHRIKLEQVHATWPNCTFVGFSRDMDGVTFVKVPRVVRRYP